MIDFVRLFFREFGLSIAVVAFTAAIIIGIVLIGYL